MDEDEEDIDGDGGAVYDDGTNERRAKSLYVSSFTSAFLQIGEAEERRRVYGCQFGFT